MLTSEAVRRVKHCGCISLLLMVVTLTGCTTLTSTPPVTADAAQSWALLPISNLSENPQADLQARQLLETRLRQRGVRHLDSYVPLQSVSLRQLLDTDSQQRSALAWAKDQGYQYAMSGTVNEWSYRSGTDREPVVGLNLKLIDVNSEVVLWQASAARTGWGFANLPALADSLIADLLASVKLSNAAD